MNQTINIKDPVKCTKCNKHDCQTTWIIITNSNQTEEITTRDCIPSSYNKLPKWIIADHNPNDKVMNLLKTKHLEEIN